MPPIANSLKLTSQLSKFAAVECKPIPLVTFARETKTVSASAQFLKKELPIRYTHALRSLFVQMHEQKLSKKVSAVSQSFFDNIKELVDAPLDDRFDALLEKVDASHTAAMQQFSQAVSTMLNQEQLKEQDWHRFFDEFYTVNMSADLLMQEHRSLQKYGKNIVQNVSPYEVAKKAVRRAQMYAIQTYGEPGPTINIINAAGDVRTLYVENHLEAIIFQVLKKSIVRSFKTQHGKQNTIKVIIAEGHEDVSFKISDKAGGIPLSVIPKIWAYTRPAKTSSPTASNIPSTHALPYSRLMARYFGGDLEIISMEGYGSDTYLHLFKENEATKIVRDLIPSNTEILTKKSNSESNQKWLSFLGLNE